MQLVFATNNLNKLSELQDLLPSNIELIGLKDIGCNQELPETQKTLQGNAMQKAEFVFEHFGYTCFADDTGLEVGALKNEPGVYSARYAGQNCSPNDNIQKVLKKLVGRNDRNARFRTVIALIIDGKKSLFEGECKGKITKERKGEKGFGYDPIFYLPEFEKTMAELDPNSKNRVSHRGKAVRQAMLLLRRLMKQEKLL